MADLNEKDASLAIKIAGADSSGAETNYVDATVNGLKVDGSAVTQPISAISLPLPNGAATETTLAALNTKASVDSISNTGSITALNGTVTLSTVGLGTVAVSITGTWVASFSFQGSVDNVNWAILTSSTSGGIIQAASANRNDFQINVAGFLFFRVIATSFTSGTANIVIAGAKGVGPTKVYLDNTVAQFVNSNTRDGAGNNITSTLNGSQRAMDVDLVKVPLTGSAPATASVGTTSSQVVAANSNRKGLIITNLSTTRVFLAFGNTAVLNSGIMLSNGGSFTMDLSTYSTQAINAIVALGTTTLSIQEYV